MTALGPLLDSNTIALYRTIQLANMLSECDLIAFAVARTATGGSGLTPFIVATVPCRLSIVDATIVVQAEQLTPFADYLLTIPDDTDTTGIERATVRGMTHGIAWTKEFMVNGQQEPRTFSASKHIKLRLATDTIMPPPLVATVVITEV